MQAQLAPVRLPVGLVNLALFDFDGTITIGDTFIPFLRLSARPQKLLLGSIVLSPIILAYRFGLISGRIARPIAARFAFRGGQAAAVRDFGLKYAREVLPGMIRKRALDRIEWHKQQGDTVVIVSASLDVYLTHWCESLGIEVICTQLEEKDGILTGRYVGGDCSRTEKLTDDAQKPAFSNTTMWCHSQRAAKRLRGTSSFGVVRITSTSSTRTRANMRRRGRTSYPYVTPG